MKVIVLALVVVAASALPAHRRRQPVKPLVPFDLITAAQTQQESYPPQPYDFNYEVKSEDGGSHSAQETSDASGKVSGSYTITTADGRRRTVTYTADETGFHAVVETNELGTESKDAADALYKSTAITGVEAALQYGDKPGTFYQHQ